LALIIVALWIGSAVAGWFLYWPWLIVPAAVIGLHIVRVMKRMQTVRERNGLTTPIGRPGTSMASPNLQLVAVTLLQHGIIFGLAAGVYRLFG
jgi:hypothetical protein